MILPHSNGVSVLICTYNGASRLDETLACLAKQDIPADVLWEIILVDNASTDGTGEFAQKTWQALGSPAPLHVLHEPRQGKQFALQKATVHVQHTFTCLVDDDNRLSQDYLNVGLRILNDHAQVGILGGQNVATFEGSEPAWFSTFQHCYAVGPQLDRVEGNFAPLSDGNIGRNVLWGAGMFVRTILWDRLRELDFQSLLPGRQGEINLMAGEDDELCYAAQLLGYEVWYSSKLRLQHHMSAGRLTEDYRNRLFYASARSAPRLNAYRNALWGKANGPVGINLIKDIGYSLLGVAKRVLSPAFLEAPITGNVIVRMNERHALATIKEILLHFGQVQSYYKHALRLKQQLKPYALQSKPPAPCIK